MSPPPRTRGVEPLLADGAARVSPARAGMNRPPMGGCDAWASLPRTRGDEP